MSTSVVYLAEQCIIPSTHAGYKFCEPGVNGTMNSGRGVPILWFHRFPLHNNTRQFFSWRYVSTSYICTRAPNIRRKWTRIKSVIASQTVCVLQWTWEET
jgi:hypothetical protein